MTDERAQTPPWRNYTDESGHKIVSAVHEAVEEDGDHETVEHVLLFELARAGRRNIIDACASILSAASGHRLMSVTFAHNFGLQKWAEHVEVPTGRHRIDTLRRKFELHILARAADHRTNACSHIGHDELADIVGCAAKTVRSDLAAFESAQLVRQHRRNQGKPGGNSREYSTYILLPTVTALTPSVVTDGDAEGTENDAQ